jgi:hypothetical protein
MSRTISFIFLIFSSLVCFGQNSSIPVSIQVPDGSKLIRHVYAKGVQIYVCTQDSKDTTHYTWTLTGPRAELYADSTYHQLIGKHYFANGKIPTWEYTDNSRVSGLKLQQADSPDSFAIPWLLLKVAAERSSGALKPVSFIQRLRTKGGKAPATADPSQKGKSQDVPYTAEYFFYSGK